MRILLLVLLSLSALAVATPSEFVTVENGKFYLGGEEYEFLGANYWYGVSLSSLGTKARGRVSLELDHLEIMGFKNLRIYVGTQGGNITIEGDKISPPLQSGPFEFTEEVWEALDFLLFEMSKRNMKAVVCLLNSESWAGGVEQYLTWAGEDPQDIDRFYLSEKVNRIYESLAAKILSRLNILSNITYSEDPTIMTWELSNELETEN